MRYTTLPWSLDRLAQDARAKMCVTDVLRMVPILVDVIRDLRAEVTELRRRLGE